jgi:hypothetical protein
MIPGLRRMAVPLGVPQLLLHCTRRGTRTGVGDFNDSAICDLLNESEQADFVICPHALSLGAHCARIGRMLASQTRVLVVRSYSVNLDRLATNHRKHKPVAE